MIAGARAYIFKAICGARDFWNDVCCKKVRSWSLNIPRMGMPPCDVRLSNVRQDAIKQKAQSLGSLDALRRAQGVQSEDCKTVCSPNSRPLRRAQDVQSAKSQIVGFLKPRFHCTHCSPHPWDSPLRGPLKRSNNVPSIVVTRECPRTTSG